MFIEIKLLEEESLAVSLVSLILKFTWFTCSVLIFKKSFAFLKAISFAKSIKGFLDKTSSLVPDSSICDSC